MKVLHLGPLAPVVRNFASIMLKDRRFPNNPETKGAVN